MNTTTLYFQKNNSAFGYDLHTVIEVLMQLKEKEVDK